MDSHARISTKEVMGLLECSDRTVYELRTRQYPQGHPKAGQRILGMAHRLAGGWTYDRAEVLAFRDWLLNGKPVSVQPVRKGSPRLAVVESRLLAALRA